MKTVVGTRLLGPVVVLMGLAVAACGAEPTAPVQQEPTGVQLECGHPRPFPASVFDQPARALGSSPTDEIVRDDPTLFGEAERYQWRSVEVGNRLHYFGGKPPDVKNVNLERASSEADWHYANSGGCTVYVHHPDRSVAVWAVNSPPPTAELTEFRVLVKDRQCASGQGADARVGEAQVRETADTVEIIFTAEPVRGNANCPGHAPATRTVHLRAPLGARQLRDGAIFPPQPPCTAASGLGVEECP